MTAAASRLAKQIPIIGLLVVILAAISPLASAADRDELANMVLQDCGSCHGMTLKGGLGPPLRPENLQGRPAEVLAAIIRDGISGTAMPPWRELLSDDDIRWISEQLKSGALIDQTPPR